MAKCSVKNCDNEATHLGMVCDNHVTYSRKFVNTSYDGSSWDALMIVGAEDDILTRFVKGCTNISLSIRYGARKCSVVWKEKKLHGPHTEHIVLRDVNEVEAKRFIQGVTIMKNMILIHLEETLSKNPNLVLDTDKIIE